MGNKKLIAIDIGNTNITIGIFIGKNLTSKRFIPTKNVLLYRQCGRSLKAISLKGAEAIIISSVMPKALANIKRYFKRKFKGDTFILGENITAPIKNRYKKPRQVGQDRLINAVAMYEEYGKGIVVDFGTAVTFDMVSGKKEYLGGIIFPGIRISLENLSLKTALLPKISLKPVKSLLGKDTVNSMRSGILNGYGALCDGIITKLKSKYGRDLPVVATGGDAPLLFKYCRFIDNVDTNLTLKGLLITYKKRALKNSKNIQSSLDYSD